MYMNMYMCMHMYNYTYIHQSKYRCMFIYIYTFAQKELSTSALPGRTVYSPGKPRTELLCSRLTERF